MARVTLWRPEGQVVVPAVEVAATPAARARGLSGREVVPLGSGMVFLFPEETRAPFQMRTTRVPLDIVFAREDGAVVGVIRGMQPGAAVAYLAPAPYRVALEVPPGTLERMPGGGDPWGLAVELVEGA